MNKDSSVGRILSLDEATQFFERCIAAEKVMGELSREDRMVILSAFGTDISLEDLIDTIREKRVLQIKGDSNV